MTLTVIYDDPFWVGIFERQTVDGYAVARTIFGGEPTGPKLYQFILTKQSAL